ncbi:substrate-binding periplasmic protein [Saccharospirillum alexandrii]|uniref:substrate-binding periplasmic protein n=1 Tax=Saccharospirillum alexandrii TaxID=2448477 RepID=UPI0013DFB0FE|nr:transporter substrate-binding domain-containing protein [Saccharospirillum alexandrii]
MTLLILTVLSMAAQSAPLVVAGTAEPPFKMYEGHRVIGIDAQIMGRVLETLEIDYELHLLDSGSRMLREAEAGHIDVIMSLSYSEERAESLHYPNASYKQLSWRFFIRTEDVGTITYSSLDDLKTWRIGAVQSWAYTPEFWAAPLNRMVVTDHRLLIDMLLSGRIDMAPMSAAETLYLIRNRQVEGRLTFLDKPLSTRPYYNVFLKNSTHPDMPRLMSQYDRVIEELKASGFIDQVYQEHLGVNASIN